MFATYVQNLEKILSLDASTKSELDKFSLLSKLDDLAVEIFEASRLEDLESRGATQELLIERCHLIALTKNALNAKYKLPLRQEANFEGFY